MVPYRSVLRVYRRNIVRICARLGQGISRSGLVTDEKNPPWLDTGDEPSPSEDHLHYPTNLLVRMAMLRLRPENAVDGSRWMGEGHPEHDNTTSETHTRAYAVIFIQSSHISDFIESLGITICILSKRWGLGSATIRLVIALAIKWFFFLIQRA